MFVNSLIVKNNNLIGENNSLCIMLFNIKSFFFFGVMFLIELILCVVFLK